jgi:hypothetical protein
MLGFILGFIAGFVVCWFLIGIALYRLTRWLT